MFQPVVTHHHFVVIRPIFLELHIKADFSSTLLLITILSSWPHNMNLKGPSKQLTTSEIQFGSEYGVDDGDNDLMKSAVFSPKPIITTPILCKCLDRGREGAIWVDGPPTCFLSR